jgi:hypothetical protein
MHHRAEQHLRLIDAVKLRLQKTESSYFTLLHLKAELVRNVQAGMHRSATHLRLAHLKAEQRKYQHW